VAEAGPRQRVTLRGRIRSTLTREEPWVRFDADLDDGTGRISLWFLGRRSVPGLRRGAQVAVEGTAALVRGRLVVLDPRHEILAPGET
jgi:hypothetical protein